MSMPKPVGSLRTSLQVVPPGQCTLSAHVRTSIQISLYLGYRFLVFGNEYRYGLEQSFHSKKLNDIAMIWSVQWCQLMIYHHGSKFLALNPGWSESLCCKCLSVLNFPTKRVLKQALQTTPSVCQCPRFSHHYYVKKGLSRMVKYWSPSARRREHVPTRRVRVRTTRYGKLRRAKMRAVVAGVCPHASGRDWRGVAKNCVPQRATLQLSRR